MRRLVIQGVRRGRAVEATVADRGSDCPPDRVNRTFAADWPNALWVPDFISHAMWLGLVYVAFIVNVFARFIVD